MAKKAVYHKRAITYDEQIRLLESRGMIIPDKEKAKEYLSDIGYFRLSFYIIPFEDTTSSKDHILKPETRIEDVVSLYYFDLDLRNILNKYLTRIEVALRTTIVYELSLKYVSNTTWYISPLIVKRSFIECFDAKAYNTIRKKEAVLDHHKRYLGKYAPAWKTMEFMTFGNLKSLYENLIFDVDKRLISSIFNEPKTTAFGSYLNAILDVRNACAHGNVLYDLRLTYGIRKGNACPSISDGSNQNLRGALRVIDFFLKRISENRRLEMWGKIKGAAQILCCKAPGTKDLIEQKIGIFL